MSFLFAFQFSQLCIFASALNLLSSFKKKNQLASLPSFCRELFLHASLEYSSSSSVYFTEKHWKYLYLRSVALQPWQRTGHSKSNARAPGSNPRLLRQ